MNFIKVNGVVLHYRLSGPQSGPTLVFSNSLGTDFRIWDSVIAALPRGLRVLCYDKRGHGLSDCPAPPFAMDDHIGDAAALMDALDIKATAFIGLSVGGIIGQGLAAARPDLMRALILCDTAHRIGPTSMWDQRIAQVRAGGIEAIAENILERWFPARFHREQPAALAGMYHMLTRTPDDGYIGTSAAIRDTDFTDSTAGLMLPVLCLGGRHDGATPPDLVASLAALIPGTRHEIIEDAGHLPCVDQPDALAGLIERFLAENGLI